KVLSPFFSRRLDLEVLVKLADIDPQCLILIRRRKGEISQGLLLVDFHQVRKLISTGKSSPITKSIAQGRSLKNLIVSPICSMRGPGFTELIDEAFCYAQRNAYDLVSLRDMPIDESGLSFTHQLVYSRRVFAIFRRDHQLWSNCIKSFEPSTRLRLDSVFL
ncbi:MAG: hypothetical protein KDD35_05960, partial [Bdellovibrionales bacterium]|nr:hypothetical protein [Bdellovibrionales bacterium]